MKRVLLFLLLLLPALIASTQQPPKKARSKAGKYSTLPNGYNQVGSTALYCRHRQNSIDFIGYYNDYYYSSTYGDEGYSLAIKVGGNKAVRVDCLNGIQVNGVQVQPSVVQQGEFAQVCYTVTNKGSNDVSISLGVYADVMIGNQDHAPISRRIDTFGQTYGLTMKDGQGAQLCVLFGSGLTGVTAVSDFWFGGYYKNYDPENMVGDYKVGNYWMKENGSYDSGMGWCWRDQNIAAGQVVVFSYLLGVGEVNLEPYFSVEVSPEDPEGWNNLNRPHRLTLEGTYESPAGQDGVIEYAVEDSEEWTVLTDVLASGETFSASLVAIFDPTRPIHTIRLRTRDLVGNTTLLPPIEYRDVSFCPVSGIEDKIYTGDSIYQDNLVCELDAEQYVAKNYTNNVNVGKASFTIEGVFPKTIGRKSYTFNILPQPLSGSIVLAQTEFVYNGNSFTPQWQFSNANYSKLKAGEDYTAAWTGNKQPGTGTLTVTGKNNYNGTLTANIHIDKAPLTDNLFTLTLPDEDITYDGQSHGATITKQTGVGTATITYQKEGESAFSSTMPKAVGNYTIYLAFSEGTLYYGRARTQVGTFSIYGMPSAEFSTLKNVHSQLKTMGWSHPWDMSQGVNGVASLQGLTIKKGHVTGLNLAGQNLTGQFPYAILDLPYLERLSLNDNHLSGDIDTIHVYSEVKEHLQEINLSKNLFSGNIGQFANNFSNLKLLDASNNCLEEVHPMIPASVVQVDLSKQTISKVIPLHIGMVSSDDYILATLPSILLYDHANQTFSPNVNLRLTTQDNSWGMTIAYQSAQLSVAKSGTQNIYYGEKGDLLNVAVYKNDGTPEGSTFRISLDFYDGDSNFDGSLNVLDLQAILNYMFGQYSSSKLYNYTASNLWQDETINVQDVVLEVETLLEQTTNYQHNIKRYGRARTYVEDAPETTDAYLYWRGNELILNTMSGVAAADIFLTGDASFAWDLQQMGFTVAEKKGVNCTHAIIYSLLGAVIPVGETIIARSTGGNAATESALLSDCHASPISVSLTASEATSVDRLMATEGDWKIFRTDGTWAAQGTGKAELTSVRNRLATGVYILQGENNNTQIITIK